MSDYAQSDNPFQTPQADLNVPLDLSGDAAVAEQIRRQHINHETSVKSSALLYGLGGLIGLLGGTGLFIHLATTPLTESRFIFLLAACFLGLGIMQLWAAFGLRRLSRPARIVATIATLPALRQLPFGMLIGGYFLYLFWSKKGRIVFSDEYRTIIAQTPHVRCRTSIGVWILLGVLLLFLALILVGSLFPVNARHRAALLPTTALRQSLV